MEAFGHDILIYRQPCHTNFEFLEAMGLLQIAIMNSPIPYSPLPRCGRVDENRAFREGDFRYNLALVTSDDTSWSLSLFALGSLEGRPIS